MQMLAIDFGKGRVITSTDVEVGLRAIGVAPDFRFEGGMPDSEILFLHRKLDDGHSYFLSNRMNRSETITAHFRVTGKAPELWHAETGKSEPVSYRIEGDETVVPLTLPVDGSVHVVFRKPATTDTLVVEKALPVEIAQLGGPWKVSFQPDRGAPATTTMAKLAPLDASAEPGIKYFSGISTYRNSFSAPVDWKPGQPLWIDLGEVGEVAEVSVNGRPVGLAWHAPYRVDVGAETKPGTNQLEVRVANLWVNRLIGDAQPDTKPLTWTGLQAYKPDAPLRRSGLIGPVKLLGQPR